ncbi:putative DNA primase large subunit [Dorcoceras hygrometricum]|uniref:Putative DNA primase large subunit n=1 Tax=Dorcoceras hygrometricum TaxID=472368 RepID=A0A2Z7AY98_9LAMI|nr:putative DNA primase large subunit [Dorcoceras hygrometricum]
MRGGAVAFSKKFCWLIRSEIQSIGYPRMSASGESSTTMHRLLHASGSHPIPPPDDPKCFRNLLQSKHSICYKLQHHSLTENIKLLRQISSCGLISSSVQKSVQVLSTACTSLDQLTHLYGSTGQYVPVSSGYFVSHLITRDLVTLATDQLRSKLVLARAYNSTLFPPAEKEIGRRIKGVKMEIVRRNRASSPGSAEGVAVSTIPLYRSAPAIEVRLEDFELYAVHRLRVLKGISDGLSRGKKVNEMEKLVKELWKANMMQVEASEIDNKDVISHFVLRLVYCREEELRKWFLSMESTLFRYRFQLETPEAQRALLVEFDLPYKAVSSAEYESIKDKLNQVVRSTGQSLSTVGLFPSLCMKVPFEQVPDLVASRRVFLLKGYAYVATNQVVSLLTTQYRSYLSKALVLTNRKWTSMIREQEKDRLTPIIEALSTSYLGPDYSQPKEFAEITLKDIDQLREDHHLKHGGRMQLGLFLKGVGLNLDDALAFWKAEFSRKVGAERFDKEYAYSIRHNYGKEGKRTDYTPYSCQKIISSTPGVGDHHGCPYRHFSEENLRAALGKMGVASRALEEVIDKVRNRHYQLACTLTFEAIHGESCDVGINHPNQYYSDSRKILDSKVILEWLFPTYSFLISYSLLVRWYTEFALFALLFFNGWRSVSSMQLLDTDLYLKIFNASYLCYIFHL